MYGVDPFPDGWDATISSRTRCRTSTGAAAVLLTAAASAVPSAAAPAPANPAVDAGGFQPLSLTRQKRYPTPAPSAAALVINHGLPTGVPRGPLPPGRAKKLDVLDPPAPFKQTPAVASPPAAASPPPAAASPPTAAASPPSASPRSPRSACPNVQQSKRHNKCFCYACGGGCNCAKPDWRANKLDCAICYPGADGMAWREKRLVAGAKSRRCKCPPPNQYADVRDCLVCATPEQRASRLKSNSLRRRRGCKCVGEAHRANSAPPPGCRIVCSTAPLRTIHVRIFTASDGCVPPSPRLPEYWCRICTPGVAGVQLRLAKTLANTFRDSLFNRTRYGTPDDHVSMVYPYFWSCGQHDVTMLGPPNYVGHFLSLNPSARTAHPAPTRAPFATHSRTLIITTRSRLSCVRVCLSCSSAQS